MFMYFIYLTGRGFTYVAGNTRHRLKNKAIQFSYCVPVRKGQLSPLWVEGQSEVPNQPPEPNHACTPHTVPHQRSRTLAVL